MTVHISRCSSCKAPVTPDDYGSTHFTCPQCGNFDIVRCSRCRSLSNHYTCHNCGFVGP